MSPDVAPSDLIASTRDERGNLLHSFEAAWRVGQLLNRLRFAGQQHWLVPDGPLVAPLYDEIKGLWDGLLVAARSVGNNVYTSDALGAIVRTKREEWNELCESLERAEDLLRGFGNLATETEGQINCYDTKRIRELCYSMVGRFETLHRELKQELERHLNETFVAIGRLAYRIDEVARPAGCFERMFDTTTGWPQNGIATWDPGDSCRRNPSPPVLLRPDRRIDEYPTGPEQGWYAEIRHRFLVLGWNLADPPSGADESGPDPLHRLVDWLNERAGANLDARQLQAEQETQTVEGWVRIEALGIEVNDADKSLKRIGQSNNIAEVRGALRWKLLRYFVQRRNHWTSESNLKNQWKSFGGNASDPNYDTIAGEISRLRRSCGSVGLEIKNRRGFGWMLVSTANSEGNC
jgi:hypothetical protein